MADKDLSSATNEDLGSVVARLAHAAAEARALAAAAERRADALQAVATAHPDRAAIPARSRHWQWRVWRTRNGDSLSSAVPILPPLPPSEAPIRPWGAEDDDRVTMALLLGFTADEVSGLVARIRGQAERSGVFPLVVTDLDDLAPLLAGRVLFERVPAHGSVAGLLELRHWEAYVERRLVLLLRKWRPIAVISFGPVNTTWLRLLRQSPYLDAHARRLLGVDDPA